jgi:Na+-driven multidrug efflux pump
VIAGVAAAGSAVLIALFGRTIFRLLGGGVDEISAALDYAGVFFPGCIALWLCHSTLSIIRGTGNMTTPSLLLFLVSLGSIPLSGALALGWGPLPPLGMRGSRAVSSGHMPPARSRRWPLSSRAGPASRSTALCAASSQRCSATSCASG